VHGAQTIQQCLDAGLLDAIHIDLTAVLPGEGVRLFDHVANTPVVLGNPTVVAGAGVTHLRYPVHTPCTKWVNFSAGLSTLPLPESAVATIEIGRVGVRVRPTAVQTQTR
jgi:hypothetical protein